MPHGVDELAGCPVTRSGAAALLATLIYMVSVDHEIVDSGVWDYQLWSDVQPARVSRDGQRMPLDVYQRLVNANFILNVDRTRLMSDFSYLAVDQRGADAFLRFRRDLVELQDDHGSGTRGVLADRTAPVEGEHQLLTGRGSTTDPADATVPATATMAG